MRTRYVFVTLAIVAGLGALLAGCGQGDREAVASSCSSSADGISVACEGKDGEMECAVTCSGVEGTSECVVTCEGHDGPSECTVTCDGKDGDMECTVTCAGAEGEKEFTITCDGKTVTCEHADGEECTCEIATVSGCPSMTSVEDAPAGCPGMTETVDSGDLCAKAVGGSCPSRRSTEGS